jgi:hypothetical protein
VRHHAAKRNSFLSRTAFTLVAALIPLLWVQISWAQGDATSYKFDFGSGPVAPGYTQVLPTHIYSPQAGFGFEPGAKVQEVHRSGSNPLTADFCTSEEPFYFSVKLPEGNYQVTVTLGDTEDESTTTVNRS